MEYVYAVARIRSKELLLLSSQNIEQLLSCKTVNDCFNVLAERGWAAGEGNAEAMFAQERDKTWELIRELSKDMSVFDVFLYANDFHNLKAAIKLSYTALDVPDVFLNYGTIDKNVIAAAVKEKDYSALPENMREAAREAYEAILHTRDGQMCDVIIDKAALDTIYKAGKQTSDPTVRKYAEITVAAANIKMAVRSALTGKSYDFVKRGLAECDMLDVDALAYACVSGFDAVCECLASTAYSGAVDALKTSASAFERWCDNILIESIRPQKTNPFTAGPLIAYIIARENEIKTARIILSGKLNDLSDEMIRERVREMYV